MKSKPILILTGDQKSIFFEILFKSLKFKKFQSPIVLITSFKILKNQMKKFNFKKNVKILDFERLGNYSLNNKNINLINLDKKKDKKIHQTLSKSKIYINNSFEIAFKILKSGITNKFINGPITKSDFLDKKYPGITEFISNNFKKKNVAMLIYNKKLSVCPITTHLPLKLVTKQISSKLIKEKVGLINNFYLSNFGKKPKIGITGLNPHCESILKFNEDEKIITPAILSLKKLGHRIFGPFSADTIFLKKNRIKYDVIIGMYHDQVLSPLKTIFEYDAINITLGLPFYRVSPDHGPNKKMIGKNLSNPLSLIRALEFLDNK